MSTLVHRLILTVLAIVLWSSTVGAELVTYVDKEGRKHYVDGIERVPQEYRHTVDGNPKLGSITKSPSVLYKQTHPKAASAAGRRAEIFVTSWCPYCQKLERYLQTRNIPYVRYDVEKNKKANETYRQLGGGGVPLTRVGSKVIAGYQPEEIMRALKD